MKYPNFREEKKLRGKGYKRVVGLDESGRGPLAGPVVAAAVIVRQFPVSGFRFLKIKDSKKLSPKKREEIFEVTKSHPQIEWGIGKVSEKVIDRINILEATKLAMQRALKNLERKMREKTKIKPIAIKRDRVLKRQVNRKELRNSSLIDFLIIDGNFGINLDTPQKSIIKADEKVFSCVLASIVGKVSRDRMMVRYHRKYPQYGFDKHKGYPTKLHKKMIKKHGLSKIHRRSFKSC